MRFATVALALSLFACENSTPAGTSQVEKDNATTTPSATASVANALPIPSGAVFLDTTPSGSAPVDAAPVLSEADRPKSMPEAPGGLLAKGKADEILKAGGKPKITLLEAGAEPRSKLGYDFTIGKKQRLGMGLTMTLQMQAPGRPLPATEVPKITMLFDLEAKSKQPTGDFDVTGMLNGIEFGKLDPGQQAVMDQMKAQLDGLNGLTMTYVVSPFGRVRDVDVKLPGDAKSAAAQTLGQMTQSFESMVAPLPEEPVGVGAKWEVITRVSATGADMIQWATYELAERDGNKVGLKLRVAQLAASPDIQAPGMPPGMSARLVKLSSAGEGNSNLSLADVAPLAGGLTLNTSMEIEMSQASAMPVGGGAQRMSFDTRVRMDFERPAAPAANKP